MDRVLNRGHKRPTVTLVVGMAGSGKTSIVTCLKTLHEQGGESVYTINLDPAVRDTPYNPNIDIRDTVDYDGIRKKYSLGPNGAILTACNLFATRFDQVLALCKQRKDEIDEIIVDTPGQIEIFTWSASGAIVCESLTETFQTRLLFVVDTVRARNAQVFLSNMLQCLSIVYKTKLPVVLAFNKIDIISCKFAQLWLTEVQALQRELEHASTYAADLTLSLAHTISEFYAKIDCVGISATSSEGFQTLKEKLTLAK
jgi:GTPase SAR1 family protein